MNPLWRSGGGSMEWMWQRMARWLREEKEWWGVWPKQPPGAVNFCNADLRDPDLVGAVLDWADFSDADLSSAKLSHAELRGAIC
ncbi:MAG: hypothetical protein DMF71_18510 [Acidobacteria bacterium]|nr:MAG: hypothetical protein DMF71_18510 [Acidobacteriota bacterium]